LKFNLEANKKQQNYCNELEGDVPARRRKKQGTLTQTLTHWGPVKSDLDPKTPDLGKIMVPNLTFGSKSGISSFLAQSDLFIVQI